MVELFLEEDEIRLILNLLPEGDTPKKLNPMFYHTLTYEGDVKIQIIADELRAKLKLLQADNKTLDSKGEL